MPAPWQLPPLILHPFSGGGSVDELMKGSKAALELENPNLAGDREAELERVLLTGRYQEIRMLLFLGKDIYRWLLQCVDCMGRSEEGARYTEESFAALVVEQPPACVREKLERWGVTDRRAVFSRAIGVHTLFSSPPPIETLSPTLLRNYHRFADHAYICFQHLKAFKDLSPKEFLFEIYASEEYAQLLSDQWEQSDSALL
jgi:hypothetical protein